MEFKHLPLVSIQPNPDNPRKTFDEGAVAELAQSIAQKGVLQPILVRPATVMLPAHGSGPQYQLVCGERRYRASKLAGLETIPATIREMSDEEALELMLTENFQRQDVHPMEEAIGFKALVHVSKMPIKQIAERVGKSVRYVADRMKLAGLIPQLQDEFYNGRFNLTTAHAIAVLSPEDQNEWMKDQDSTDDDWSEDDWRLKKLSTFLTNAPFDKEDPKLIRQRGACSGCEYNTATSELFPDEADAPRCLNRLCYIEKCKATLLKELKDDTVIIIEYGASDAVKKIAGSRPTYVRHEVDYLECPTQDELNDEIEDSIQYCDDPEEQEEAKQEVIKEWNERLAEYEKEMAAFKAGSGKYKQAMHIKNDLSFEYVLVLPPNAKRSQDKPSAKQAKEVAAKIDVEKVSDTDLNSSLEAVRDEIKRLTEITEEKIHKEVTALFEKDKFALLSQGDQNNVLELKMAAYLMIDEVDHFDRKWFIEGITGEPVQDKDRWLDTRPAYHIIEEWMDRLHGYSDQGKAPLLAFDKITAAWLRYMIVKKYPFSNHSRFENVCFRATLFRDWTRTLMPKEVAQIEFALREKSQKKMDTLKQTEQKLRDAIQKVETKEKKKK